MHLRLFAGACTVALSLAVSAAGQIIPRDAATPVRVVKGKGDFAARLNGAVMPRGKGWKAVSDAEKRFQLLLVPEKWKVEPAMDSAHLFTIYPSADNPGDAALMVLFATPKDDDPFSVDEEFAVNYADAQVEDPMLKKLGYRTTDAGLVMMRGMNLALAGWSMSDARKRPARQEVLIYIGEDRLVTLQFTATEAEFKKHAEELAKVFASYQNLGVRKLSDD